LNFQKATGAAFYQVSWECDGNYKIINEAKYTHDYQKTGTFNVCIRSGSPLAFYAPGLTTEEKAKLLKIKQWGYIKWSSFESAFYGMRNMQLTASDAPNLSAVTNMSGAFSGLANFTGNEYMNTWNTINVTDMSNMFLNSPKFNAPIGNWKTDNVENMSGMFRSAKAFNQPIENWNTGNVTNMSATFYVAEAFNQDISKWNTEKVTDMTYMFARTKVFNQPIGGWNTSSVLRTNYMFWDATKFNNGKEPGESSGALNWNTSSVNNMTGMFLGTSSFNQDISNFNISSLNNATNMLNNSGLNTEHYDALLNSWAGQPVIKSNVTFGATGINYCAAKTAHNTLTSSPNSWAITDAGPNCPPQDLTLSKTEIYENTTEVGTISSTDESDAVVYTFISGEGDGDNLKFALDTTSGLLVFSQAPDFENPQGSANPSDRNKYTIRVRATDPTGLYSEQIFIITVKDIDDVAPVIQITSPANKVSKGPVQTTFKVSDRYSIKTVELDTSSVAAADIGSMKCTAKKNTSSTGFPYENSYENPTPETHLEIECTLDVTTSGTLVLKATDKAGYSSTAEEPGYIIDTLGPTFTIANISIGASGVNNPTVLFKADDPTGVDKYQIYFKNELGVGTSVTIPDDPDVDLQSHPLNLDPDETPHMVEIKAYDTTGNTTSRRIIFPPIIEINAPTIISNEPINDTTVKITTSDPSKQVIGIGLTGESSTGASITQCKDQNDNIVEGPPYNSPITCEISGIQKTGMLQVYATETDNQRGENLQKYFYDREYPKIVISAPTKIKNEDIDVNITITDNVDLFANDISIHQDTTAGIKNNQIVCDTDDSQKSIVNCTLTITSSGKLVIEAKDKARNSSIKEEDFIVDKTPPTVTIEDNPAVISSNNQINYALSGTCTADDNNPTITINTQPYITTCSATGEWTLLADLSTYSDGDIAVEITQTDIANNTDTASKTLFKKTTGPNLTFNIPKNLTSANQSNYTLTGTCPSTEPSTITLKWDDSVNPVSTFTTECQADNTWEKTITNLSYPHLTNINVTASQLDTYGNITERTFGLQADTQAPILTLDTPPLITTSNQSNYTLSGTCSSHLELNPISITIVSIKENPSCINGKWSQSFNLSNIIDKSPVVILTQSDHLNTTTVIQNLSRQAETTPDSSNSTSNSDSSSSSGCHDQAPGKTPPAIYSAVTKGAHSILLSFRPADKPVEKYILQYGTKSGSYPYGSQNLGVNSSDSMSYLVNHLSPNTTYYFRIKAANGCATGNWSNEISATTHTLLGFNQLETVSLDITAIDDDSLENPSSDCQTYVTKSGDTLWSIARQLLGSGNQFQKIIDQNSDEYPSIKNSFIKPGWTLKINCHSVGDKDESSSVSDSGLKVQVKVVDTKDNPIQNAKVIIHSKVQEAWTNSEGIAEFNQVEPGDHKVIISYNNYQGEQNINLSDDSEIKIHRLDIVIKKQKFNLSPWLIIPVAIIILFLIYRRYRQQNH
jgi:surface protein